MGLTGWELNAEEGWRVWFRLTSVPTGRREEMAPGKCVSVVGGGVHLHLNFGGLFRVGDKHLRVTSLDDS